MQNTITSEERFRAELSEYGVRRLELARVYRALRPRLYFLGYAVTYPTEYKRVRAAFPGSALGGAHGTIRIDKGVATRLGFSVRFIRNAEADTQNYSVRMRCYVSLFCSARCCSGSLLVQEGRVQVRFREPNLWPNVCVFWRLTRVHFERS